MNPIDEAYAGINALGGVPPDGDAYVRAYWRGYSAALDDALSVVERLGGMDPYIRRMAVERTAA